ncbi:MAG: SsrA-binding protein SmpB, partial [Proteobacteria bacterium]|nr:SsrA-binding protein SmpB [Pseudomonadota bacterium]
MRLAENRKASHDYFIEDRYEAGLALMGWEVKAIRAGRSQLKEAYVVVRGGEVFLIGCHISPLTSASTHVTADPTRTRKLLLHAEEIAALIGKVERAGYTLVPLDLHLTRGRV